MRSTPAATSTSKRPSWTARAKMTGLDFGRLRSVAMLQPILAKRFYHKTGALLWFDVDIAPLVERRRDDRELQAGQRLGRLVPSAHRHGVRKRSKGETYARGRRRTACGLPVAVGWSRDNYAIREARLRAAGARNRSRRQVRAERRCRRASRGRRPHRPRRRRTRGKAARGVRFGAVEVECRRR